MGRGKAPKPPEFSPSEIRYGDTVIGKTFVDPATKSVVNQYFPDPAEEERKRLAQQRINNITSTLGYTAPELAAQFNDAENAFVNDAEKKFSEQYDPALRSLRENIASRFGTLNSSQFLNGLNDLEKNRSSAFVDIINRGKMIKNDLVSQDEARKLNELQSLTGVLSKDQASLLNNLQVPLSSSNAMNDFLNSQWMTQLQDYRAQQEKNKMLNNALGNLFPILQANNTQNATQIALAAAKAGL
ncbi:MAG: hypothetical protein V2B14_01230 [bacterium]